MQKDVICSLALTGALCCGSVFAEQAIEPDWIDIEPQILQNPPVVSAVGGVMTGMSDFSTWCYTTLFVPLADFSSREFRGLLLMVH